MKTVRLIMPSPRLRVGSNRQAGIFKMIPLQLTTIASLTPQGWKVEIEDESVHELQVDGKPDVVGITVKACSSKRGYEIAAAYRRLGVPVLIGGSHASLAPQLVAPHADSLVIGGVEENWPRILEDAVSGRLQPRYESRSTRPMPSYRLRWDLLPRRRYRLYSVVASRGCPLRCNFCSIHRMYAGTVRRRSVEDVVSDILRMPSRFFVFWDEHPTSDRAYAKRLFRTLAPHRRRWVGEATTMVARDQELLQLMMNSGCNGLFIGIESVSKASLRSVRKSFNRPDDYAELVKVLNDHGIHAHAGVVMGFDHDDEGIFDDTLEYLYRCGFGSASFKLLTPYPGTELHEQLRATDRILDEDMDHYDEHHVVFRPACMSPERLAEGYQRVIREFYSLRNIGKRFLDATLAIRDPRLLLANFGWRRDYFSDLGIGGRHSPGRECR